MKRSEKTEKKSAEAESRPTDSALTIPDDPEQSVYRFIIVAAKRARQLQQGARPKITAQSKKPTRVAVEETRRGLSANHAPATAPAPEEEAPSDQ
jgi:DNA-directed RNA polymerase subunit omega